ncbi:hypothetical protein DFH06DRAFT_1132049 [Mycena polygramma]|nr:hypothetical protein DFH06DRAFT_1132049 [Mycena polygramma]
MPCELFAVFDAFPPNNFKRLVDLVLSGWDGGRCANVVSLGESMGNTKYLAVIAVPRRNENLKDSQPEVSSMREFVPLFVHWGRCWERERGGKDVQGLVPAKLPSVVSIRNEFQDAYGGPARRVLRMGGLHKTMLAR